LGTSFPRNYRENGEWGAAERISMIKKILKQVGLPLCLPKTWRMHLISIASLQKICYFCKTTWRQLQVFCHCKEKISWIFNLNAFTHLYLPDFTNLKQKGRLSRQGGSLTL